MSEFQESGTGWSRLSLAEKRKTFGLSGLVSLTKTEPAQELDIDYDRLIAMASPENEIEGKWEQNPSVKDRVNV